MAGRKTEKANSLKITKRDEEKIKEETKATSRCIAFSLQDNSIGKCFYTGKETSQRVIFAKAY